MTKNRKRKNQILLRLSDEEYEIFKAKQGKTNLSQNDFLIQLIKKKQIKIYPKFIEVLTELSRIGNNLNQVTRAINKGEVKAINFELLTKEVEKVWQLLKQEKGENR